MKPACSLVEDASLGPQLSPSGSGCHRLRVSSGRWTSQQLASSAQSFVLCVGLAVSYVRAFCGLAIPQSGFLSHVSSLRLPLGHSGPVLTPSNAACTSLSSPRLLVADASVWAASPLGVAIRHLICGFYLFIFPPGYVASEIPRLATDLPVRVFPGIWKLSLF